MKYDRPVSTSVIRRLPRYYRFLGELLEKGINRISSKELSTLMKITASQIRQDLNCFGGFGQQGYGYQVESLHREIGEILGLNKEIPAILVGVGNLGRAVAPQLYSKKRGFRLVGAFDEDRKAALEAGMNGHLAKPLDVELLKKAVAQCTNRES